MTARMLPAALLVLLAGCDLAGRPTPRYVIPLSDGCEAWRGILAGEPTEKFIRICPLEVWEHEASARAFREPPGPNVKAACIRAGHYVVEYHGQWRCAWTMPDQLLDGMSIRWEEDGS